MEFNRVRSVKDVVISLTLVIAGAVLVALPTSVSVNILGFFMIFAGLILVFILKSGYKMEGSKTVYKKSEKYFAQSKKDSVTETIGSAPENIDLTEENKGNGLRVDTYYNVNADEAYCRVYEYIPYKYEPCSAFHKYSVKQVSKLIK